MKEIDFLGDSISRIRDFPDDVRQDVGYQLELLQRGRDPDDWKPMPTVGTGVREIRIRDASGAFRIFYVTSIGDKIYVLHAFKKKSQQTSRHDIEVAKQRFNELKGSQG